MNAAAAEGLDASAVSTIAAAVVALGTAVITGWLTLRGKREETRYDEARALGERQEAWMTRMEQRLHALEVGNEELREKWLREEEQNLVLRLALRRAIEYLRDVAEWGTGPRTGPPPVPDLAKLEAVLVQADAPTARLPPSD